MYRNYDGLNRLTGIGENVFLDDSPSNGEQFNTANADYYLTINVYDTISSAIVNSLFTAPPDYTSPVYSNGNLVSTAYRTRYSDSWNFKYYKYDVRGRVIKMWNIISGFDTLIKVCSLLKCNFLLHNLSNKENREGINKLKQVVVNLICLLKG